MFRLCRTVIQVNYSHQVNALYRKWQHTYTIPVILSRSLTNMPIIFNLCINNAGYMYV